MAPERNKHPIQPKTQLTHKKPTHLLTEDHQETIAVSKTGGNQPIRTELTVYNPNHYGCDFNPCG